MIILPLVSVGGALGWLVVLVIVIVIIVLLLRLIGR